MVRIQSLHGRTAIVTGAAGNGMGRSIALTLAREGANVVVNYLTSAESAAAIVAHIEGRGGRALACRADVMQPGECRTLVESAVKAFGQVDVCIIGPGGGWHPQPIDQLDAAGALDDVQKELAPIYHLMRLVLKGMYQRKWGRLIAIALTPPYASPAYAYNVAKAARTHAMLIAHAAAWQHGVTLNTVAPGPVTPVEDLEQAIQHCDHGPAWHARETITPQDVAEGVAFLCSPAGEYITGAVVPYLFR